MTLMANPTWTRTYLPTSASGVYARLISLRIPPKSTLPTRKAGSAAPMISTTRPGTARHMPISSGAKARTLKRLQRGSKEPLLHGTADRSAAVSAAVAWASAHAASSCTQRAQAALATAGKIPALLSRHHNLAQRDAAVVGWNSLMAMHHEPARFQNRCRTFRQIAVLKNPTA